ncbi:anti-sigma factor [Flagellatimonas centrodinii]|uniref:anti-sigma factor n=1 Tax=Flagellatimonas centrodinii TaxID=2806210 RepID=UPI001FEF4DE6|nr:anti-sigma factor [Flagellatimonas centrodinii]ULQ47910.1 anti-sigma factor [Flagellatimonas centrodinii]
MSSLSLNARRQLAGAYVLGTLRGLARRGFSRRMQRDPALAAEVQWWERQFHRLHRGFAEQTPPAHIWPAIARQLVQVVPAAPAAATADGRIAPVLTARRPGPPPPAGVSRGWRVLALAASLVAMVLGGVLVREVQQVPPAPTLTAAAQPHYIGALEGDGGRWLVSVPLQGGLMKVRVEGTPALAQNQAAELWWIGADGTPRSLGVLPSGGELQRVVEALPPAPSPVLAVSLEPLGGSPTGQPTGPVVAQFAAVRSL